MNLGLEKFLSASQANQTVCRQGQLVTERKISTSNDVSISTKILNSICSVLFFYFVKYVRLHEKTALVFLLFATQDKTIS